MRDPSGVWVLSLCVAGVVVLSLIHRRHMARACADRARLFEDCSGLVEDAVLVRRGLNFPLLQGRWRGHDIRVEPVIDTLSMRTLPVLWIVVTIRRHHDVADRLSVLARACGTEFYARHNQMGVPVPMGPEWPDEVSVRSTLRGVAAERPELLERIGAAMGDGSVKQIVLGPSSARVVWKCATAESGTYRVTRRVDLTQARVDARALEDVLNAVDEITELFTRCVAAPAALPQQAVR